MWLIYGYIDKINNKIKYIGQTSNLEYRRYKHEEYDPFHENVIEYNYPLSRAIRKYGVNNYQCIIIEDNIVDEIQAIIKEEYWIKFYNTYKKGYNQTPGGKAPKYIKFKKETIEKVKEMLINKYSFKEIQEETNISLSHISEINTGKRHYEKGKKYPLNSQTCGKKLSEEEVKISQKEIGNKFNVVQTVISRINLGKSYKKNNEEYPIRKK